MDAIETEGKIFVTMHNLEMGRIEYDENGGLSFLPLCTSSYKTGIIDETYITRFLCTN